MRAVQVTIDPLYIADILLIIRSTIRPPISVMTVVRSDCSLTGIPLMVHLTTVIVVEAGALIENEALSPSYT